ncbi:hypothetical protein CDAR_275561 [Caerostris darwini]|uniref:Uncharacterized protein n=1 Tax=Caerostris darwini TaxID=1538125 RepID=A0AAV4UMT6_9ARAC|nr:hypothetical protein CDAR_275561 [Caerostris darwini]
MLDKSGQMPLCRMPGTSTVKFWMNDSGKKSRLASFSLLILKRERRTQYLGEMSTNCTTTVQSGDNALQKKVVSLLTTSLVPLLFKYCAPFLDGRGHCVA